MKTRVLSLLTSNPKIQNGVRSLVVMATLIINPRVPTNTKYTARLSALTLFCPYNDYKIMRLYEWAGEWLTGPGEDGSDWTLCNIATV